MFVFIIMTQTTAKKFPLIRLLILFGVLILALWAVFRPSAPKTNAEPDKPAANLQPVVYDVQNWTTEPKQTLDFKGIKAKLGTAATVEEALDFYGNHAKQYRFSTKSEPPFYVIESDGVLEVVWYYATAKDNDAQKQASLNYAKRVYQMMGAYAGDAGQQLVKNILQNPNKTHEHALPKIPAADCADYRCRIVILR